MERISALMDGELEAGDALVELGRIKSDENLLQEWETYHLIGDVLRKDGVVAARFCDRFRETLGKEPTILAPRPSVVAPRKVRLYALSAAASLAGVAAVAWLAFMNQPAPLHDIPEQTAQGPGQGTVIVDTDPTPSVDEYLLAQHHAIAPVAAFPGVAPYLQNVDLRASAK